MSSDSISPSEHPLSVATRAPGQAPPPGASEELISEALTQMPPEQQLAIRAIAAGHGIGAAARKAGVSRSTLYRWQQSDGPFAAALNAWRRQQHDSRLDRARALGDLALNNVYAALLTGDPQLSFAFLKHLSQIDRTTLAAADGAAPANQLIPPPSDRGPTIEPSSAEPAIPPQATLPPPEPARRLATDAGASHEAATSR
jgi:hypothetical protein